MLNPAPAASCVRAGCDWGLRLFFIASSFFPVSIHHAKPFGEVRAWQGRKHLSRLVLQTTNRKQGRFAAVAPVGTVVVVVHEPAVGVATIVLGGTPPVTDVADIEEIATRAVAARQGGKSVIVRAVTVIVPAARCF